MANFFGVNFPFWVKPNIILDQQTDTRLIKNDILQLLLTNFNERRMRRNFGTNIRKFPFESGDSQSISELRNTIISAIDTFEKRVKVKDVIITSDLDSNRISISVLCALTNNPNVELSVELVSTNEIVRST